MQLTDAVDILVDCLEVLEVEVFYGFLLGWSRLDLVDDGLKDRVAIVVEECLKELVLVVYVVNLDDESLNSSDLVL